MRTPRTIYSFILVLTAAWCGSILLAPLLAEQASPLSRGIYTFFHRICHQFDERSLHLAGHPLAVCSRCTAIYFAFLAGVILYPFVRTKVSGPARRLLFAACVPMILDVAAVILGVYEPSNGLRVATGAVFGLLAALIVLPDAIGGTQALFGIRSSENIHQQGGPDASKTR
jgi:uncharacterized membrane protein